VFGITIILLQNNSWTFPISSIRLPNPKFPPLSSCVTLLVRYIIAL
jgi:hypothetical protein